MYINFFLYHMISITFLFVYLHYVFCINYPFETSHFVLVLYIKFNNLSWLNYLCKTYFLMNIL